ncbi:hypothetical protein KY348_06465 [Candidatus Woesearchaeota archaeon]|nr:hypothetical protein [Candidatus Woesearchaeota archaeon]
MKRVTKLEIVFGLFALALIYLVIANNASITGFVISPAASITLVAPTHDTQTKATSIYFMFKYPSELDMKECSLILNDQIAKTATGLLSPYDTRIRTDLVPGTYIWSIECIDTDNIKITSPTRRLIIGEEEESELTITKFPNRAGYIYEFEIKDDLELDIDKVMPNDVIRARKGENTYEINIMRIIQDYSKGIGMVGLMITPGDKRMNLHEKASINLDFNNDGQEDIELTLNYISYKKAYFTVSTKQESNLLGEAARAPVIRKVNVVITPVLEEPEEAEPEQQQPASQLEKSRAAIIVQFLLIALIVILIIAIIIKVKSRKEEEKEYITKLKKAAMTKVKKKVKKTKKKTAKKKTAKKKAAKKKLKKKLKRKAKKKAAKKKKVKKITKKKPKKKKKITKKKKKKAKKKKPKKKKK